MDSTQINNSNTLEALDCISRQAAIDAIHEDAEWLAAQGSDWQVERMERDKSILKSLPAVQLNHNAEVSKMEIIHCKDCKRQDINNDFRSMWCHEIRTFVKPDEFCCWAEKRGEADGQE